MADFFSDLDKPEDQILEPRQTVDPAGADFFSALDAPQRPQIQNPNTGPAIEGALDVDPDAVSKARKDANDVGLSFDGLAPEDAKDISREAQRRRIENELIDAPVTADTLADPKKAQVLIDDVASLTTMERISRGFKRGALTREIGLAGYEASLGDEVSLQRATELQSQLQALGHDDEGFVSYLAATAKVLGQQFSSFADPQAAQLIGGGGALGATAGLAGGPFAPVTSAAGAAAGMTAGAVSHFTVDSYQVEAGHAYLEQIELGIDPAIAKVSAHTVGLLNAGLEIVGAKLLLAPISEAKRRIFQEGVRKFAKTEGFKNIAARAAKTWATGVAGEVSTEVAQETVNIIAAELSKSFDKGDFETITSDEVAERLAGIAEETFKGTVLLAGGSASVQYVSERVEARKAKQNAEKLQQQRDAVVNSKAFQRDPDTVAEHVAATTKANAGMDSVYLPAEALLDLATMSDEGKQIVQDLGIETAIVDAYETGSDVKISVEDLTKTIMPSEAFEQIRDHVRIGPEEMTAAEADLVEADTDVEANLGTRVPNAEGEVETVAPATELELAEQEMGLKALFSDAKDVGMTEPAYKSYLAAVQEASETGKRRQEQKRIKEEERKLSKEYAMERERAERDAAEEVAQQPIFEVMNSIGRERLDRAAVEAMLPNGADQLNELPKANGRAIVTQRGEKGVDPDTLAELYGFVDGQAMLFAMIDAGSFENAVQERADQLVRQRNPDFSNREKALEEARQSLLNSSQSRVIEMEVNALRQAEGQKRVSAKALRAAVKKQVSKMTLSQLEPTALLNSAKRAGVKAGQLLRAGDRQGATKAKLQQLKAFEAAKEAYRTRAEITKKRKFLRQFSNERRKFPSLPVEYLEKIRETLEGVSLGSRITSKREESLRAFAAKKLSEGVVVDVEGIIDAQRKMLNWQDMTLEDFNALYNSVRRLHKAGVTENKMLREAEQRSRDEIVSEMAQSIETNIKARPTPPAPTRAQQAGSAFREAGLLIANGDTILRELDGGQDLGPAQQAIKAPYNRAYRNGYNEGQIGYGARSEKAAEDLAGLYNVFDAKERANMRRPIKIPGVDKQMSHGVVLSVLLNSGNADNKAVLLNEFTEAELSAIYNHASKRDWDFAQSVWDYLETYWPEVEKATVRRQNYRPERVQAEPIQTKYGEYSGGYFPIRFDNSKSLSREEELQDMTDRIRYGQFVASHTKDSHTKERNGSRGKKLLLDPFVINSHIDQVVYDLEMGDAINDIYKVLYHPGTEQAFKDLGRTEAYHALDLWFRDIVSGEMHLGGISEHVLRHLRAGFTISKLGMNIGTTLMQPMGLLQSAVVLGKRNVTMATMKFMHSPLRMAKFASETSGLMRIREETFNKEITLASQTLSTGAWRDIVVGRLPNILGLPKGAEAGAKFMSAAAFYTIKKAQRMVDLITYQAAFTKGMQKFGNDQDKAVQYAEDAVVRAQASGIFGDRSAFERGTTTKRFQQSEWVRAMTPLMSYFIAKNNIAYERTKQTNFRNPGQVIGWASDMAMLFTVEAMLTMLLRGEEPDPEDEGDTWLGAGFRETGKSVMAGIPFLREFASEAQGFRGGGVLSSTLGEFSKFWEQMDQGDVDEALVKSGLRLGGVILQVPTSQPLNTGMAIKRELEGEDMEFREFIFGPQYTGPR